MKFSGCGVKKYESGNENENCPTNAFNFDLQVAAALLKVKWLGYFQYAGGVICTCMLVWYRFPQVQTGYAPRRAAAAVQKTWLHPAGKMKQCLIKKKKKNGTKSATIVIVAWNVGEEVKGERPQGHSVDRQTGDSIKLLCKVEYSESPKLRLTASKSAKSFRKPTKIVQAFWENLLKRENYLFAT